MHILLLAAILTCQQWINEIDKYTAGQHTHQGVWVNLTFYHPLKGGYVGVGEEIFRTKFKKAQFLKAHPQVKTIKISTWSPI